MTTEQIKEKKEIIYVKQVYKRLLKMHQPLCEDKNWTWGCISCQSRRFLRDFESYIDWLEHLYIWEFKLKKKNVTAPKNT